MSKNEYNLKGLWSIQFAIESLMINEIDKDKNIPEYIINDLAHLHANIIDFTGQKK